VCLFVSSSFCLFDCLFADLCFSVLYSEEEFQFEDSTTSSQFSDSDVEMDDVKFCEEEDKDDSVCLTFLSCAIPEIIKQLLFRWFGTTLV
jgi:hypothetical protein